jgi:hypothetical protein
MDTNLTDTDFSAIEHHIRAAHLERSVVVGRMIANLAHRLGAAVKSFFTTLDNGYAAELDRRAMEADAFLRRSAPRY